MMKSTLKASMAFMALACAPAYAGVTSQDAAQTPSGHYAVDPTHTSVAARINHMGFSTTTVSFNKISGGFDYDAARPQDAKLDIAIDATALSSGFDKRDMTLKSGDFFNVAAFPVITFHADHLTPVDATHATVQGNLTLLGVTRPVSLDVTFNGVGKGMMGDTRTGFTAKASILRSEFGMKTFLPAIGDQVTLWIDAEFSKSN